MMRYWVWLSCLRGLSLKKKHLLLAAHKTPDVIYRKLEAERQQLEYAEHILEINQKLGIKMVTVDVYACHTNLKPSELYRLPLVLYYKGQPKWHAKSCAVVGSRNCTFRGYQATQTVVNELVADGFVVNSGLAVGIDGIAHEAAIRLGGYTQAFVAHGLEGCYPKAHLSLMAKIADCGAVISPFPVGTKPVKYNFLHRNEIMVLLSDRVAITELEEDSGTMRTAEYVIKHGKPLLTVPIACNPEKASALELLMAKGASVYDENLFRMNAEFTDAVQEAIMTSIETAPLPIEAISRRLNMDADMVATNLYNLEMNGIVGIGNNGTWKRLK